MPLPAVAVAGTMSNREKTVAAVSMMSNDEMPVAIEVPLLVAATKKEFVPKFFIDTIQRLMRPKFMARNIQIILDLIEHYSADINANYGLQRLRSCIVQVKNVVELMIVSQGALYLRSRYERIFAGTQHYNANIAKIAVDSSAETKEASDDALSSEEFERLRCIYEKEVQKKRAFAAAPKHAAGEIVECKSAIVNNRWSIAVVHAIFRYDNKIYYFVKYGNRDDMLDYISAASQRIRPLKSCKWHSMVHASGRRQYADGSSVLKNVIAVPKKSATAADVSSGSSSDSSSDSSD